MPTNAYLDVAASIMVIMIILSLHIKKQSIGRANMQFTVLCYATLFSGLTDILNLTLENIPGTPMRFFLHYLSCYLYFLVRDVTTPLYIFYICSQMGIRHRLEKGKLLRYICAAPFLIDVALLLANPFNHLTFSIDPDTYVYSRGPLMLGLYAVAFYYLVLGIIILIKNRRLIPTYRFVLLISFIPLNLLAVIAQMLVRDIRVEIIATVMFLLILAIGVQRPEEMIDPVLDTLSNNAFIVDMKVAFNSKRPMSVLLFHIDNHVTLRNSLGLFAYNVLLKKLTAQIDRIGKILRVDRDFYYLDGGSLAIVTSFNDYDNLLDMGRMLHAYMNEPVRLNNYEVMVESCSCIINCPEDISTHKEFMSFARSFQHKLKDRQSVTILSNSVKSKDFIIRNSIDDIIAKGISNNSFEMYYQPIYSIKQKKFVSAEALIRLKDEQFGYISPGLFIPAAEKNGAIHQIGDFVLDSVCELISSLNYKSLGLEYIEINLSVAQCVEQDLVSKLMNILEKHDVSPEMVNLEITETAVDYDSETTNRNIAELSQRGITFSLDDFGTGFSNISRVVKMPLNIVKLDKCLVDEMDNNQMWIVIKDTVRMLQKMNKKVLVEGVETERAFKKFEEIGCDYIQGYYFSRPLPIPEYLEFIMEHNI